MISKKKEFVSMRRNNQFTYAYVDGNRHDIGRAWFDFFLSASFCDQKFKKGVWVSWARKNIVK